jgi:hypothetical protein
MNDDDFKAILAKLAGNWPRAISVTSVEQVASWRRVLDDHPVHDVEEAIEWWSDNKKSAPRPPHIGERLQEIRTQRRRESDDTDEDPTITASWSTVAAWIDMHYQPKEEMLDTGYGKREQAMKSVTMRFPNARDPSKWIEVPMFDPVDVGNGQWILTVAEIYALARFVNNVSYDRAAYITALLLPHLPHSLRDAYRDETGRPVPFNESRSMWEHAKLTLMYSYASFRRGPAPKATEPEAVEQAETPLFAGGDE